LRSQRESCKGKEPPPSPWFPLVAHCYAEVGFLLFPSNFNQGRRRRRERRKVGGGIGVRVEKGGIDVA